MNPQYSLLKRRAFFLAIAFLTILPGVRKAWPQESTQHYEMRVKITSEISSRLNRKGDRISALITSPPSLGGGTVEGEVREAKSSGSVNKKSQLDLVFDRLVLPNHAVQPIRADIKQFINSKGQVNTDEEGEIVEHQNNVGRVLLGTAIGAAIGAAAGGAKGAAIGGGAGAATSLVLVKVMVKGPSITFEPGSEFLLDVRPTR